jgi:hypothetical protein
MNSIIYRYIRPLKFNTQRFELETQARGGVCLRFERRGEGTYWFTHARCRDDELFSKTVAKQICDDRALKSLQRDGLHLVNHYLGAFDGHSANELVQQAILHSDTWQPPTDAGPTVQVYLLNELRLLGSVVRGLEARNKREQQNEKLWKDSVKANQIHDLYARVNQNVYPLRA